MTKPTRTSLSIFAACTFLAATIPASAQGDGTQPAVRALTMQEAVRMTLSRAPEVLLAEAQAARAREALRESRTLNQPRVYAGTGLAYNNGFPLSIEGSAPSIFKVSASQPILSRTNGNLIREAAESAKAGQIGTEAARNELAMKTASAYYELHQSRRVLELTAARLDAAQKQQQYTETLLAAGKIRPVEATQVRTAVLAIRQQMLVAREQAAIAEKELRDLTGLGDTAGIRTLEPKIDNPLFELQEEAAWEQAFRNSPEILKAEAEVRAKDFHVEAERGGSLPKVEIVSQYALFSRTNNYEDYFRRFVRNNFLIGLSVQVPVFDGSTGARVAQSRQEAAAARFRLQSLKSGLKLNIQRCMGTLRIAQGAVDLGHSDVDAAREMVQVSETLADSGRLTAKELEESRAQLLQKELSLLDADRNLFQRKLDLLYAAGSMAAALQ